MTTSRYFFNNFSGGSTSLNNTSTEFQSKFLRKILNMHLNNRSELKTRPGLKVAVGWSDNAWSFHAFRDAYNDLYGIAVNKTSGFLIYGKNNRGFPKFANIANAQQYDLSKISGVTKGLYEREILLFGPEIPLLVLKYVGYNTIGGTISEFEFAFEGNSKENGVLFSIHSDSRNNKVTLKPSGTNGNITLQSLYPNPRTAVIPFINGSRVRINGGECIVTNRESAYLCNARVVRPLTSTDATKVWSYDINSIHINPNDQPHIGPSIACWHQNRLVLCGMPNHLNYIWFSKIGIGNNFDEGSGNPDEAIIMQVPERSESGKIINIINKDGLWIQTKSGFWRIGGSQLTLSDLNLKKVITRNCSDIPAISVDSDIIFSDEKEKIYRIQQDQTNDTYRLSEISYHLPKITEPLKQIIWDNYANKIYLNYGSSIYLKNNDNSSSGWSEKKIRDLDFATLHSFSDTVFYVLKAKNDKKYMLTYEIDEETIRDIGNADFSAGMRYRGSPTDTSIRVVDDYKYFDGYVNIYDIDDNVLISRKTTSGVSALELQEGDHEILSAVTSIRVALPIEVELEALPFVPSRLESGQLGAILPPYRVDFHLKGGAQFSVENGKSVEYVDHKTENENDFSLRRIGVKFFGNLDGKDQTLWRLKSSGKQVIHLTGATTKIR